MAVDLTKLVFHSSYPAYKNNNVYTGTLSLNPGNTSGGLNTQTFTIPLETEPDLVDVIFRGNSDASNPTGRPDSGWFKQGAVYTSFSGTTSGVAPWLISSYVDGTNLVVTAYFVQTFTSTATHTAEDIDYRIVDYSAF